MIRFAAALVITALAAGCAGRTEEPPPVATVPAEAPGGYWLVTAAQAAAPLPAQQSPYLGQVLALEAKAAGAPSGRFCDRPSYSGRSVAAAGILGGAVRPAETRDPTPRPVIDVWCGDEEFGSYLRLSDGSLLTRVNDWILRLEPAPTPVPVPVPVPVPPPPALPPAPAPAPAATVQDHGSLVYLASYRTEAGALAGWAVLAKASPLLKGRTPVTRTVELGAKGVWVRLYAKAATDAERGLICKQLAGKVDECGARNRE